MPHSMPDLRLHPVLFGTLRTTRVSLQQLGGDASAWAWGVVVGKEFAGRCSPSITNAT